MTEQESKQLDAEVHRKVFGKVATEDKYGHYWTDEVGILGLLSVPRYSLHPEQAWKVIERMNYCGYSYGIWGVPSISSVQSGVRAAFAYGVHPPDAKGLQGGHGSEAETMPEAVCRAAIGALLGREKEVTGG